MKKEGQLKWYDRICGICWKEAKIPGKNTRGRPRRTRNDDFREAVIEKEKNWYEAKE